MNIGLIAYILNHYIKMSTIISKIFWLMLTEANNNNKNKQINLHRYYFNSSHTLDLKSVLLQQYNNIKVIITVTTT